MERIRRNERMVALMHTLYSEPNKIFTLSHFCDLFGTAKSSMSEDIDILRTTARQFNIGEIETVTGAAGGVRFRPYLSKKIACTYIQSICDMLSNESRILPGDYLYFSDILSRPDIVTKMGIILASEYYLKAPNFVLTMETKGIPVALMTANALGIPLIIARRSGKVYEGSAVNISYVSGSGGIETMSLSRRAIQEGQRALIVDDFLKGGGTAKGMIDLMAEFNVTVVGTAFVMETERPEKKRISGEKSLMTMDIINGDVSTAVIRPSTWLINREDGAW